MTMETLPNNSSACNRQLKDCWFETGKLRTLVDALPILIAYVNSKGRFCFNNLVHQQWFGYSPQEIAGMSMEEVFGADACGVLQPYVEQALCGDRVLFELVVPYQRLGPRFICASYVPDRDADGQIRGFFSVISDIGEIRHADDDRNRHLKEASHTARLNSMGELTSQIIHEVSQPLAAIVSYSEACSRLLSSGHYDLDELITSLNDIGEQAERAGKIIRNIRNFVNRHETRFVETDINSLVEETLRLMELDPNWRMTQFQLDTDATDLRAKIDPVMIEQVILNLLHNGLEAMQDIPLEQRKLTLRTALNNTGEIEVTIDDNGPGLSNEQAKKLFLPFNSSKPNGMGMGLIICRSILDNHGGRLWASTNSLGGARFCFTLPAMQ